MDINQPNQDQKNQAPVASAGHSCCGGDFKKNKISTMTGVAILIVIAAAAAAFVLLNSASDRPQVPAQVMAPETSTPQPNRQTQTPASQTEEDTTAAISEQLNNIPITDSAGLDAQFKNIDEDLSNL